MSLAPRRIGRRSTRLALACAAGLAAAPARAAPTLVTANWLGGGAPSGNSPEYRYWLNPALWSTGAVPVDTVTNNYLANFSSGVTVFLNNVPNFYNASSATVYDLNLNNSTLYVSLPLTVEDTIANNAGSVLVQGTSFTVGSHVAAVDNQPSIAVTGGGQAHVGYVSDTLDTGGTTLSADGTGTLLDLHTLQSATYGLSNNYRRYYYVTAANGGTVDLSGLSAIARVNGEDDVLTFTTSGGGQIKFDGLQSINNDSTGIYGGLTQTRFVTDAATFTLPALATARTTEFDLPAGCVATFPALVSFKDGSVLPLPASSTFTAPVLNTVSGSTISVGGGATFNAPLLADAGSATITLAGGATFNAPQLASVANASITVPRGAAFTTGVITQIDAASIAVSGGVQLTKFAANGDNFTNGGATLSADGVGSLLDLHTVQSVTYGLSNNYRRYYYVTATGGGTVDLSGLTTISRVNGEDDVLTFTTAGSGTIKLDTLQSINNDSTGIYGGLTQTRFVTDAATFTLPALATARTTELDLPAGCVASFPSLVSFKDGSYIALPANSAFDAPVLNTVAGSTVSVGGGATFNAPLLADAGGATITVAGGGTFNAPKLATIVNASIAIPGGATFTTGTITQIDGASIAVSGGAQLTKVVANAYNFTNGGATVSADGAGSLLDLHTVQSSIYGLSNNYRRYYYVTATGGGTVDLSGLTTIARVNGEDDVLTFTTTGGGTIKLGALQSVNNDSTGIYGGLTQTRFSTDAATFTLPALATARTTEFDLPAGCVASFPSLVSFKDGSLLYIPNGGTVNAPKLNDLSGSTVNAAGNPTLSFPSLKNIANASVTVVGGTLTTGPLTNIDNATLTLAGGVQLNSVTARTLNMTNGGYTLSVDGTGTLFDFHTVQTLTYGLGGGQRGYGITATNNAKIDLSGVTAIARVPGEDDILYVTANSGGTIDLSALQSVNNDGYGQRGFTQTRFNSGAHSTIKFGSLAPTVGGEFDVTDATGTMTFAGDLQLGSGSSLNAANGSTVTIAGNFKNQLTAPAAFQAGGAVVRMAGAGVQTFEAAGVDGGPMAAGTNGNFALGQLQVGTTTGPTEVDLKDATDNGNRGTVGAEALYLNGANGQGGLVLNAGSLLVIGSLNAYVKEGGSYLSLQGLFTAGGPLAVPFNYDGSVGYVARTSSLVTVYTNAASGLWDTPTNWSGGTVPMLFNDVTIDPLVGVTVAGPAGSSQVRSIAVDTAFAGSVSVLNLTGPGTVTATADVQANGRGQINVQGGTLQTPVLAILGSVTTARGTSLVATAVTNQGTLTVGGSATAGTLAGVGATTVSAGGVLSAGSVVQSAVTVSGVVVIPTHAAGGGMPVNTIGALNVAGGTLDLTNNALVLTATPLPAVAALVRAGLTSATGIVSSTAAADATRLTTVGVILNVDGTGKPLYGSGTAAGPFDGQSPATSAVLVKYTYYGDANLDGVVDGQDYIRVDAGYAAAQTATPLTGWYNGDFNYDGKVDGSDYTLIDNAFNLQRANLSTSVVAVPTAEPAAVPEPGGLAALAVVGSLLNGRRSRRR